MAGGPHEGQQALAGHLAAMQRYLVGELGRWWEACQRVGKAGGRCERSRPMKVSYPKGALHALQSVAVALLPVRPRKPRPVLLWSPRHVNLFFFSGL